MGGIRRVVTACALLATFAATMTASPGAAAQPAELPALDEAIERLVERGVTRGDIVVQTGTRNYAGPACPGEGWLCTDAGTVVQHAETAAINVVDCSPDGTTSEGSCSVVQVSAGGDNTARCDITDDENISFLSCSIDQTNTTGLNRAETFQNVSQSSSGAGVSQDVELQASVTQQNQSGHNFSTLSQAVGQSLSLTGPFFADHSQEARMCASVHQRSTSGDNASDIDQFHTASSDVLNVIEAEQRQQSAPVLTQPCGDGGLDGSGQLPNLHVVATQFSDTGAIEQEVDQQQTLDQTALSVAGPTLQQQGPDVAFSGGGLAVELDGDTSNAVSTYTSSSEKDWTQDATSLLEVAQVQNDRKVLSGIGLGFGARSYRDCTWLLDTALLASQLTLPVFATEPVQTSSQRATTHCTDSTNGTISSTLNGSQQSQTFTEPFVNEEVNRGPGAPESGPRPFPRLHKAVVNDSREEGFGGPESPSSTVALPGEQIRFRLTAVNSGAEETTLTGGSISDVLDPRMTFDADASSPSCADAGDSTVTCSLPAIPGGGAATVDIVVDLDPSGEAYDGETIIPNTARLSTEGEAAQPSNTVHVRVLEPSVEPELHKAVIVEGDEGGFEGPESPATATAFPGDLIRYRLTAHNHGHPSGTGTDVVISEIIPEHMTFFGCTGPCAVTGIGPGATVSFSRPDVAGGGSVVVEVVFMLDPEWAFESLPHAIDNTAWVTMSGSGPIASNTTTVTVEAFPSEFLVDPRPIARTVDAGR